MPQLFQLDPRKVKPQGKDAIRDYPTPPPSAEPAVDDRVARAKMLMDILVPKSEPTPDPRLAQAADIESKANTPAPKPQGLGQTLGYSAIQGLRGMGVQGGYPALKVQDEALAAKKRDVQLEQAKTLRGAAQQDFANTQNVERSQIERAKLVQDELAAQDTEAFRKAQLEQNKYAPFGTGGLFNTKTSEVVRQPDTAKPPNQGGWPTKPVMFNGKRTEVLQANDPDDKVNFGHEFIRTATGLQDVTGKTTPIDPSEGVANRQDVAAGRKEVMDRYNDLNDGQMRFKAMTAAKLQAEQSKNPGASDMVLLSNHIGMTFGNVKGARTGRDLIEAHLAARSLPEKLAVAAQSVLNGQQLSPQQRAEFLLAAKDRLGELQQAYDQAKQVWDYTPPGERAGAKAQSDMPRYERDPKNPGKLIKVN